MKKCICCNVAKTIGKEGALMPSKNGIHEHNFSCYECLEHMKKAREMKQMYEKLKILGIIDDDTGRGVSPS